MEWTVRHVDASSPGAPPSVVRGAAAAAAVFVAGCGGGKQPTYPAGGKVVFSDGTPLPGGWVSFRALDADKKVSARGPIQSDGTFELTTYKPGDGAVEGQHQALVVPVIRVDRGDLAAGAKPPPSPPPIDKKFSNFETSGLEFMVTNDPRKNEFDIVVTPPSK
jgi:hypothetical protein